MSLGTFALYFGSGTLETYPYRTASGGLPRRGRVYHTAGGERIDQVAYAAYGFQAGAVEAILAWNPGLADLPYHLPEYLAIELPELRVPEGNTAPTIDSEADLWA